MTTIETILWDKKSAFSEGRRPLLAHYASLEVVESILKSGELWLSSPFLMNDASEFRYLMSEAINILHGDISGGLSDAFGERKDDFISAFRGHIHRLETQEVFGFYVSCFCEHIPGHKNGLLSMWRAYGDGGKGGAIVLKTSELRDEKGTPFIFDEVEYKDVDRVKRDILKKFSAIADVVRGSEIERASFNLIAKQIFDYLIMQSLFTKHNDFSEEREWRLVYRKALDNKNEYSGMESYCLSDGEIRPVLKLKMEELIKKYHVNISFHDLIDSVILGPRNSSPLNYMAYKRMVKNHVPKLSDEKIIKSGTPLLK